VADYGRRNIPGGKVVAVELMRRARAPRREAENHAGESALMSETLGRWRDLASSLAGQRRMACSKVSGASTPLGQVVGTSLSQAGCA